MTTQKPLPLLVFAVMLWPAALPFIAASDPPLCLFATSPGRQLADTERGRRQQAVAAYTLEERDYLIRTVAFEAAHETNKGKAAVAHVILNRKRSGKWGSTIKDVVTRPRQFEPWTTRRREIEELSPNDSRYQTVSRIADAVLDGEVPDPTAGATHFLNPVVVRQRRGGSLPRWASGNAVSIGSHAFYAPAKAGAEPNLKALVVIARVIFRQRSENCKGDQPIAKYDRLDVGEKLTSARVSAFVLQFQEQKWRRGGALPIGASAPDK